MQGKRGRYSHTHQANTICSCSTTRIVGLLLFLCVKLFMSHLSSIACTIAIFLRWYITLILNSGIRKISDYHEFNWKKREKEKKKGERKQEEKKRERESTLLNATFEFFNRNSIFSVRHMKKIDKNMLRT